MLVHEGHTEVNFQPPDKAVISCSVLVVSCDLYRDLWTPFFKLFWRYWPDCPFPVYLGSNFAEHDDARVTMVKAGEERSWSDNLKILLQRIESQYVLLMLEDFFLDRPVSSSDVEERLTSMIHLGGAVMRLTPQPGPDVAVPGYEGIGKINGGAPFRVSAQPAIWKRDRLLGLLQAGETAWEFELNGTARSGPLDGFYATYEPVVHYRHVVERGKWFWSAARDYRHQSLGCDFDAREVMSLGIAAKKALNRRRKHLFEAIFPVRLAVKKQPATTARLAFLTNFIPPYRRCLLTALASEFQQMRVLVSTEMESNRPWRADWSGLDVRQQSTITMRRAWKTFGGEDLAVHVPLDTLRQLQEFKPEVVISAELGFRTIGAAIYRKLHPQSRLAVWADVSESSEHGRGVLRGLLRRLLRKSADIFLVNGESGARYLRSVGVPEARICRVPSTIDVQTFSHVDTGRFGSTAHRLLFVGQLIPRKGLLGFLDVLSKWAVAHPERSVEWVIAGDGPLRDKLARSRVPTNLSVRFLGVVPYEDMPNVYADAGIFVLPTLADAWGMTVNEAMGSGLPVLGSLHSQAVEEMVKDGVSGWTFRADRDDEILSALDRSMRMSEEALNKMRIHARGEAVRLTPELIAKTITRAVKQI